MRILHPPPDPAGAARGRRRCRRLAAALVVAAMSAGFWAAASGSAWAGWLTLISLAGQAGWSRRAGVSLLSRTAISFFVGGTWAALELILSYRLAR